MPTKRARRTERCSRPNPFINFRDEVDEADDPDDAEPREVARYWDGTAAVILYDDGTQICAERYERSETGFLKAVWLDGSSWATEIVNRYCDDDGRLTITTTSSSAAGSKAVMKRPAAKQTADEEPDEKGEEEEKKLCDDEGEEGEKVCKKPAAKAGLRIVVRAGHHGAQTLLAIDDDNKKKYQIMQATPRQCNEVKTPLRVCESVMKKLIDLYDLNSISVETLRDEAVQLRDHVLSRVKREPVE